MNFEQIPQRQDKQPILPKKLESPQKFQKLTKDEIEFVISLRQIGTLSEQEIKKQLENYRQKQKEVN